MVASKRCWIMRMNGLRRRDYHARRNFQTRAGGSNLSGKTCLVTGSTDGIGQHTATKLAECSATVLVHGRNGDRVEKTVVQLQQMTRNAAIQGYTYDLSSLQQVKQLAEAVHRDHPHLDLLINNAGVYETKKRLSQEGFELTWAVNVLAPFLLTQRLLGSVREAVINVASISAANHLDLNNLQQEKGYSADDAYSLSKLCNIVFTLKLAEHCKARGLRVNCLDPGTVNTKMLLAGWGRIGIEVSDANSTFKLATDPQWRHTTGSYFVGGRESRPPSVAADPVIQGTLWKLWSEQTGAVY